MITNMAEKINLEELSEKETIDAGVFIGSMAERFKYMTSTIREMNQRIENFIKDFYAKDKGTVNSEYTGRD